MARLPWRRDAVVNAAMNPRDDGLGVVRYRAIAEALHDIVINQSERETP
jgi:DNA-binding transcriptional regulator YbjK